MFPIIIKNEQNEFIPLITMPQPWTTDQFEKIEASNKENMSDLLYRLTNSSQMGFEYFSKTYMAELPAADNFDLSKRQKRFLDIELSLCPSYKTYYAQLYLYYWYYQPDFEARKKIINAIFDPLDDEIIKKLKTVYLDISFAVPTRALLDFVTNNLRCLLLKLYEKSVSPSDLNVRLYEQVFGSRIIEELIAQGPEKLGLIGGNNSLIRDISLGEARLKTLTAFSTRSIPELREFFKKTETTSREYGRIVKELFEKELDIILQYPDVPFGEFGQFHFEILDKLVNEPPKEFVFNDFYRSMEQGRAKRRSVVVLDAFRRSLEGRKTLKFKGATHNQNCKAINEMLGTLTDDNSSQTAAVHQYLQDKDRKSLIDTILSDEKSDATLEKNSLDEETKKAIDLRRLLSIANKELEGLFEQQPTLKKSTKKTKNKAGNKRKGKSKGKSKAQQKVVSATKIKLDGAGISSFSVDLFLAYAQKRLKDELARYSAMLQQSPLAVASDGPQSDFSKKCAALESKVSKLQKSKNFSHQSLTDLNNQVETLINNILEATTKLEAPVQEERQAAQFNTGLDKFCNNVLQHFTGVLLVEAQNCGGRISSELSLSMGPYIRKFFHNRIFEYSGEADIGARHRKLSLTEKFAFYVTRKSNTDEIWFCISLHRWVLKDSTNWDAISKAYDFIDPEHWKDSDRWLGNSYYVLHIPYPIR